jgi:hypothetical protein
MARSYLYRNYRFIDKDPICDALRTVIRSQEHLKNHHVHEITGVASQTIDGWLDGATRRPQNATICQVTAALGYVRRDELLPDGSVVVGFVKEKDYDYVKERAKQADFFLKHHTPKPKRPRAKKAKKKNGRE